MAKGVHHTVFRVLHLLSLNKDKIGGLGPKQLWITEEQRKNLYANFDGHVRRLEKDRANL